MDINPPRPGSPPGRSPGRVGRYDLLTELSSSAVGARWAARVASGAEEGRLVSVRRIALRGADAALEALTAAGITAMRLRDPKIVAVLDVAHVERELLVASEYVDGESLRTLLRTAFVEHTPIPPPVALRIAVDVLRAARAATRHWMALTADSHSALASAVWGGLSPDSIMIAGFGDSLLADAGISGTLAQLPSLRQRPDWVCYRSPEQLALGLEGVSEQSDVFSIGVLLWEMLANRPLFRGNARSQGPAEAKAVADRVVQARVERLDRVARPGAPIPPAAVEVVARSVQRDRQARFESLDAMLGALKALPTSNVATPEQVVVVLNQLARSAIQRRHAAIERTLGRAQGFESQMPESGRSTVRPLGAAGVELPPELSALAPLKLDGLEEALQQFSEHEVPTRSGSEPLKKSPATFADEPPTHPRRPSKVAAPGTPPFTDEPPTQTRRQPGAAFAPLNPLVPSAPILAAEPSAVEVQPVLPSPPPVPAASPDQAARERAAAQGIVYIPGGDAPIVRGRAQTLLGGHDAPPPTPTPPVAAAPPVAARSDSESGVEASFAPEAHSGRQARGRVVTIGVLALAALVGIIAAVRGLAHTSSRTGHAVVAKHAAATAVAKRGAATALSHASVLPAAAPAASETAAAAPTAASSASPSEKRKTSSSHHKARHASQAKAEPALHEKALHKQSHALRWPPPPPPKPKQPFKPHGI